jgi:cobalt/nickel transport system permease protein
MSHLHIPDGVLPLWLWLGGLIVALLVLGASVYASRASSPQQLAYRAALGALMLAVMSVPLGPFGYHLSMAGVLGVLLGPAASFQVCVIVSGTLALFGHGGLTVVGLNALVLGAGAAAARPVFRMIGRRLSALVAVVAASSASDPTAIHAHGASEAGRFALVGLPLWLAGVALEAGVAYGVVKFLERVNPSLLPSPVEAPS